MSKVKDKNVGHDPRSIARAERRREQARLRHQKTQAAGRDIGEIPMIVDPERREDCRWDLKLHCETYHPKAFYLGWAEYHLTLIAKIQDCVFNGSKYAYACPRGGGKSTVAKIAMEWALLHCHISYGFLIGSTTTKAESILSSIKMYFRFNHLIHEDFPEVSIAVRELKGRGNAANGQLCLGESTLIEWAKDEIVLPRVPPPPNLDLKSYPNYLNPDGTLNEDLAQWAPTSEGRLKVSGITGEGIRGAVETTQEGEEVRPDAVLLDDPQTDDSASSETQNKKRYELVQGAVLGMEGPDKSIGMVMPCTVIQPDDMVSQLLDRTKNPLFRGDKIGILESMPTNMKAWEKYFAIYEYCAQLDPPNYEESNKYYIDNQDELDEGAVPTWEDRCKEGDVSAIQTAMNIYCRHPALFWAEYMNAPKGKTDESAFLEAGEIQKKMSNYVELEVPLEVQKITAFMDIQHELVFWAIVGWTGKYNGHILKYGTYPEQERTQFSKKEIPVKLSTENPELTEKARIRRAVKVTQDYILNGITFKVQGERSMAVDKLGIDTGDQTTTIRALIRELDDPRIVPCEGWKAKKSSKPMNHPDNLEKWTSDGRRLGPHWRMDVVKAGLQTLTIDTNHWKTAVHEGFATPIEEDSGSISLFRQEEFRHSLFAQHQCSEFRVRMKNETYGNTVDIWNLKPGSVDNDWFDCMVGCITLASVEGISVAGVTESTGTRKKRQPTDFQWDSMD